MHWTTKLAFFRIIPILSPRLIFSVLHDMAKNVLVAIFLLHAIQILFIVSYDLTSVGYSLHFLGFVRHVLLYII